jgi:hypothetical protein
MTLIWGTTALDISDYVMDVDCGDETVFLAYPSGDGEFEDGERASYLRKSQIAIAAKMNEERPE